MSDKEKGGAAALAETDARPRKFIFNGMELPDLDPAMKPEQVRDVWAGTYPELQNAKVKGPENGPAGERVFTFTRNVGHLG